MQLIDQKWSSCDFAQAMENAIVQNAEAKYLKRNRDKLLLNGFWRNGDKQNVCVWLDRATWYDAKTGEGGGCKEFAKTAFNMDLLDFMKRFGNGAYRGIRSTIIKRKYEEFIALIKPVNQIWLEMLKKVPEAVNIAKNWFESERGFTHVEKFVGSGFTCLNDEHVSIFEGRHHGFIRHRLSLGKQVVVPIRSPHSHEVKNLFFRTIKPSDKNEKTRLLPGAGGWSDADGSPRGFGFPHLIKNFSNLIICEGMADYIAAECLLEQHEKYLPIGAANADALIKWSHWLNEKDFAGHTVFIYHLDKDENGKLSRKNIGPFKAIQAAAILKKNGKNANLFKWFEYLDSTTTHPAEIHDLADSLKAQSIYQEASPGHLSSCLLFCLSDKGKT